MYACVCRCVCVWVTFVYCLIGGLCCLPDPWPECTLKCCGFHSRWSVRCPRRGSRQSCWISSEMFCKIHICYNCISLYIYARVCVKAFVVVFLCTALTFWQWRCQWDGRIISSGWKVDRDTRDTNSSRGRQGREGRKGDGGQAVSKCDMFAKFYIFKIAR